jgi:S1-C subfamily serine protease
MAEGGDPSAYGGGPYGSGPPGTPGYGAGSRPGRPPWGRRLLRYVAVAVLAAAGGSAATLALYPPAAPAVPSPAAMPSGGGTAPAGSVQQVVNRVEPGLVVITTSQHYDSAAGAATGMVISPRGLVLTNNHVIAGATKITATVVATGRAYPAAVVGYDKSADVALIQLRGAAGLPTVPVGSSATPRRGMPVVALGNADGQGTIIAAGGRITGLGKTITASDQGGSAATETLHQMIQTSAGIVAGDSGGPLASPAGQVIGMDTAGNSVSLSPQAPATGFAIPINSALAVARQIAAGHASAAVTIGYPPFVGIFTGGGTAASPQVQAQQQQAGGLGAFGGFGFGFGGLGGGPAKAPRCYTSSTSLVVPKAIAHVGSGALVDGTICGSPAATAGITGGSVITAIDGHPAGSPAHLMAMLARFRPGQAISLTWVSPAGQHTTSSLHLAAGPPQ